jgi:hypothetical protein
MTIQGGKRLRAGRRSKPFVQQGVDLSFRVRLEDVPSHRNRSGPSGLVKAGKLTKAGTGRKGDPFTYALPEDS